MKLVILLLAGSVMVEVNVLAGLSQIGDHAYHGLHLALMALLLASQVGLYRATEAGTEHREYARWFSVGLAFTLVGDLVNSAISGIEPVSQKLSFALVLFGAGYATYSGVLWHHDRVVVRTEPPARPRLRYLVLLPIAVVNLVSWVDRVEDNVRVSDALTYGSFAFNLTIYVALPAFAFWYFLNSRWSIGGLVVLVGAVLIPYSDLVLFGTWLDGSDPAVASRELYALNWILYFGGQCLISTFPALVIGSGAAASGAD